MAKTTNREDKVCGASKRVLEKLDNPPDLGVVKGRLSREEIYNL